MPTTRHSVPAQEYIFDGLGNVGILLGGMPRPHLETIQAGKYAATWDDEERRHMVSQHPLPDAPN